ncbi:MULTISPECIES: hypothetical protein [unclassified Nocardia]|uniref:hypothetical protein n=1 Tax=unclassified Nocardia TaxID=2637762 RepID=UPI003655194D
MNQKTDSTDNPTADEPTTDVPVETSQAQSADQAADPAANATTPAAEPEFVMPSKWAIRRMIATVIWKKIRIPLLVLVAVVAVVTAAILGWKLKQDNDTDAAAAAGLDAARAYAVTLTSVDSGNLDRDFTAVLDGSTGEFKDTYTRSSGQLRQLLLENKATGKGTVLDAAVKSATPTKVEAILFVDQTVTNTASPDPRVDRSRVMMTMELVDGRWLASRVALP